VHKHKDQIKTIYTQILSYDTFEMQKKDASHDMQDAGNITD